MLGLTVRLGRLRLSVDLDGWLTDPPGADDKPDPLRELAGGHGTVVDPDLDDEAPLLGFAPARTARRP